MHALTRYFYASSCPDRVHALLRVVPALLALDIAATMLGHGARYGVSDFNVAHFHLLDQLLPTPTPALYVGDLILCAVLGLAQALSGQPLRGPLLAICCGYTLSWSSSMLDSYQHHYFISLLLFCCLWLPDPRSRSTPHDQADLPPQSPTARWGGFPLLCVTTALLYAFAAWAKVDDAWLHGHTLLRSDRHAALELPQRAIMAVTGLPEADASAWLATAVIPLEALLALAYLLAPLRCQHPDSRALALLSWLAFCGALALHIGIERMGLRIGLFSYYMLALAVICLGPRAPLAYFTRGTAWLTTKMRPWLDDLRQERTARVVTSAVTLCVAGLLTYIGQAFDLPGALAAHLLLAGGLCIYGLVGLYNPRLRGQPQGRATFYPLPGVLCVALGSVVFWCMASLSHAQFDYYRFQAGDLKRRGELRAALDNYQHAERYAPEGRSRVRQMRKLRQQLAD